MEFWKRPSGFLWGLHVGSRLRQVADEVDVASFGILSFRQADGEQAASHFDADRNCVQRLGNGRQDAALIGSYKAATPVDDHLRRKCRRQAQGLNVLLLTPDRGR